MHPPGASPKSLQTPKRSLSGVPGPSPEASERSPSAPRAPLERPRGTSGAPPEVARSAQRMQQGTGDLKTSPWHLKKLNPEAPGTSFRSFRVRFCELFRLLRCLRCSVLFCSVLFSSVLLLRQRSTDLPPIAGLQGAAVNRRRRRQYIFLTYTL